jgi:uncharacterized protein
MSRANPMNLYDATVPVFTKLLGNVDRWIETALASAQERKFDPEILNELRLAPDQYPLRGQVQSACDTVKFAVAKLAGREAPVHPDTEKTIAELRARIRTVLDYVATFHREEFVGAEDRDCAHAWMQGKSMRGGEYLDHFVLPNLHFHLTTAYAILRHNGVRLGKRDYLGHLPLK